MYVEALVGELDDLDNELGALKTVFAGGGTPTLLEPELLVKILRAVVARAAPGVEVTMEANPGTITEELAACLKREGANRISLGAQSFIPRLRGNLGRSGKPGAVGSAVKILRNTGFENINVDLLFGIPGQELADLKYDLQRVLSLSPEHISYYGLSVKRKSGYGLRWARELKEAGGKGRLFYETVIDTLEQAGYHWYETSNYALPGRECRHNIAYWDGSDYIGIGAGAWSTLGYKRWHNVDDVDSYIAASGNLEKVRFEENLTTQQKQTERLMLGLRQSCGVERGKVEAVVNADEENKLVQNGFLSNGGGKIFLTRAGRFVANEVCARLLQGKK